MHVPAFNPQPLHKDSTQDTPPTKRELSLQILLGGPKAAGSVQVIQLLISVLRFLLGILRRGLKSNPFLLFAIYWW